jgi:hypothetical protein
MNEPEKSSYRKMLFAATRLWASVFMVITAIGAISLATDETTPMDPGLRWGTVVVMAILSALSMLMIFAPTKRKNPSGEDRHL